MVPRIRRRAGRGGHTRHEPDPSTGSLTTATDGWRFAGFFGTPAVLVVLAAWLLPAWLPVVVLPPTLLTVLTRSLSGEDPPWLVGAAFPTGAATLRAATLSLVTVAVRSSRGRPWRAPILGR